jgi:hypothetical protein
MDNAIVSSLADAIAYAEGFFIPGSRPARNHNPGDLTVDTISKGIGMDGPFVVYANDTDGWDALKRQVDLMLTNASQIYNNQMTIRQVAQLYTTTDQLAWATAVASRLGVSMDTKLADLVITGIGFGVIVIFAALWWLARGKHK